MRKIHYAWVVCAGCTLMLFMGSGISCNTLSAAYPYFRSINGFSATEVSLLTTIRCLATLFGLFTVPLAAKRVDYRLPCALSCVTDAISLYMYAFSTDIRVFYVASAILGFGLAYGFMLPVSVLIGRWFNARRGTALGICSAVTGFTPMVFSPVLTAMIESRGLRFSLAACATLCLIAAIPVFFLIRPSPESMGTTPFGELPPETPQEQQRHGTKPNKAEWLLLLYAATVIGSIPIAYGMVTLLNTTAGLPAMPVSFAYSVASAGLMGGKLLFGVISDRIGNRSTNMLFLGFALLGVALCCLANLCSVPLMFIGCLLTGLGTVTAAMTISTFAADFSTPQGFPEMMKRFQIAYHFGSLTTSLGMGMLADKTGSYIPGFLAFGVFLALGTAVVVYFYYRKKPLGSR